MSATLLNRERNKTRYLNQLYRYFPQNIHTYAEPFFGTGSVFLNLPTPPQYSFVNDHDKFIYYFFLLMQTNRGAEKLAESIEKKLIYYKLIDSNKSFTNDDLENLVDILQSRNWRFAISCMDSGISFYKGRGMFISKIAKSTGVAASKGLTKYEYIATNYPPTTEKYMERDLAWD